MSYIEDLILLALLICRKGSDIWLVQVSLYYFDIVEMHCPDWIMRQFELSQHIPNYIDIDYELHSISVRVSMRGIGW